MFIDTKETVAEMKTHSSQIVTVDIKDKKKKTVEKEKCVHLAIRTSKLL